MPERD